MPITIEEFYQKPGAVFSDGQAAQADKNSLFSPELRSAVESCYANMLANNILLEPVSYSWNQGTHTLHITKVVSSIEDYTAAKTFNGPAAIQAASNAGWVYLPRQI